jgi:hypothetical protein
MRERDAVASLIDRLVAAARIPSRAAREDLRRELSAHFEDAGSSPEAMRDALRRFGVESEVADSLRRVYRCDYLCLYFAKVAASIGAGTSDLLRLVLSRGLALASRSAVSPPCSSHG